MHSGWQCAETLRRTGLHAGGKTQHKRREVAAACDLPAIKNGIPTAGNPVDM
jgi:hypothetical protein